METPHMPSMLGSELAGAFAFSCGPERFMFAEGSGSTRGLPFMGAYSLINFLISSEAAKANLVASDCAQLYSLAHSTWK